MFLAVSLTYIIHSFITEMIHSLFTINTSGDLFLEKHWKSVISRSIIDYFFDAQNKAASPKDISPVIATPHHYLISIFRQEKKREAAVLASFFWECCKHINTNKVYD